MSVIHFSHDEWQRLFDTLYQYHHSNNLSSRIRIVSEKDIEEAKAMLNIPEEKYSDEDALQYLLANFVKKIALANQLTYGYTYCLDRGKKFEMKPFEELKDPSIHLLYTHNQLFKQIGSIIYNCLSNGGTNFLTQELLDKLRDIQISCGYKMAGG